MCHPLSYTVPDFATEADVRVTRLSSRLSVFGLKRMTPLEEAGVVETAAQMISNHALSGCKASG